MKLAYFFVSYPGTSQSFLQREIRALARLGFTIEIHVLLRAGPATAEAVPAGTTLHPFRRSDWFSLPVGFWQLLRHPALLKKGWRLVQEYPPRFAENWFHTWLGLVFALAKFRHFQKTEIDHFHAAWATAPATAAAILSALTGHPFSFGAQAYDIYRKNGDAFLRPKMLAAKFIHTTTQRNVIHLSRVCPDAAEKIQLIRRGVDELPPPRATPAALAQIHLLSVARLIPKKGLTYQIAACALLRNSGLPFHLRIIGDGPLRAALEVVIRETKLENEITLCGALPQAEVRLAYQWAHVFWHTGIVDAEGDRDGLPNVVPEAFAHRLPVISSSAGSVTEAVHHEKTGLVVEVTQPEELAAAVRRLFHDAALRQRLGENGRRWVEENFLSDHNVKLLAAVFRHPVV